MYMYFDIQAKIRIGNVLRPKQIRRFNFISTNTKALGEYTVLKRVSHLSVFKYVIIIYIIWLHIHLI